MRFFTRAFSIIHVFYHIFMMKIMCCLTLYVLIKVQIFLDHFQFHEFFSKQKIFWNWQLKHSSVWYPHPNKKGSLSLDSKLHFLFSWELIFRELCIFPVLLYFGHENSNFEVKSPLVVSLVSNNDVMSSHFTNF